MRRFAISILAAIAAVVLVSAPLAAGEAVNKDASGVAIRGYDPVAYFTDGKPTRGAPEHEHVWEGATWRFASEDHRALFANDPEHYAPRYGGFCTGGMALGRMSPIDPEAFVIIDGRLYLNYDRETAEQVAAKPEEFLPLAEEQWKRLGQTN